MSGLVEKKFFNELDLLFLSPLLVLALMTGSSALDDELLVDDEVTVAAELFV